MIDCSWKSTFGIECLTCGFQRSVVLLFKGEFTESFFMFPATLPLLVGLAFLGLHLWRKWSNGPKILVAIYSLTAVLMVSNYIIKLTLH